jgi:beta-lactamase regulating signal transducer with metallopeptidase domain
MLWWLLQNTLSVAALAALVALICGKDRLRSATQHALWLVVLIKFLTPPLVYWPWSPAELAAGWEFDPGVFTAHGSNGDTPAARDDDAGRIGGGDWDLRPNERLPGSTTSGAPASVAADPSRLPTEPQNEPRPERPGALANSLPIEAPADSESPGASAAEAPGAVVSSPQVSVAAQRAAEPTLQTAAATSAASGSRAQPIVPLADHPFPAAPPRGSSRISPARLADLLYWLWLAGALIAWLRQAVQVARLARVARCASPSPAWLGEEVRALARQVGVRPPEVRVAAGGGSPQLICLLRPVLIWPEALVAHAERSKWRPVMIHELAHLKRLDHRVAWLEVIALGVWWWNPLFWWVRRRLRLTAELACDGWVVELLPQERLAYAETLLEICRKMSPAPAPVLGVGTAARRTFERRLTMVLTSRTPSRLSWRGLGAAILVALPAWSAGQTPDRGESNNQNAAAAARSRQREQSGRAERRTRPGGPRGPERLHAARPGSAGRRTRANQAAGTKADHARCRGAACPSAGAC